ncbi:hypothetical protein GCU60_02680 [Blastococcus saxobsidens]|uniref:Uncharacterized protein n=1 Tax=Blastococcus saxobsidens TaxID=138336 RepID=A0A6L9VZH8_9ACTN|nr:hypothetical protein [Blastococcus saxobsidens]NEK84671.1 hypothetical protein [Blastococcus saxobsidens]
MLVLPLGVLLLAGCAFAGGSSASPSSSAPEDPTAPAREDIERQLTGRDDVAEAEVLYRDDVTVPGSVAVDVTLAPGGDREVVAEEIVRLVWTSPIEPVNTITIEIGDPQDPPGLSRIVSLSDDAQREAIESQYGPRPE